MTGDFLSTRPGKRQDQPFESAKKKNQETGGTRNLTRQFFFFFTACVQLQSSKTEVVAVQRRVSKGNTAEAAAGFPPRCLHVCVFIIIATQKRDKNGSLWMKKKNHPSIRTLNIRNTKMHDFGRWEEPKYLETPGHGNRTHNYLAMDPQR